MWYRTPSAFYYIDEENRVWRVWNDGLALLTDLDAECTAGLCSRIEPPDFASVALRAIETKIVHAY